MTTPESTTVSFGTRWLIIGLLFVFVGLGHFNRQAISVVGTDVLIDRDLTGAAAKALPVPGIRETPPATSGTPPFYHVFSDVRMGAIYTALLTAYTLAMIPGGWFVDKVGASWALCLLGLTMGIAVALTGIMGWIASSPLQLWLGLMVVRGLAGICTAPLHPGAAHIVASLFPAHQRARCNGLVTAGAMLGIALYPGVFRGLMVRTSWPAAFVICGVVLVAYGFLWRRLTRGLPHSMHSTAVEEPAAGGTVWSVLTSKDLWIVTLSYAAYSYFQYLFFYWMGYYFFKGVKPEVADAAQFWIFVTQGAGMVLGGLATDLVCRPLGIARGRRTVLIVALGLSAVLALAAISLKSDVMLMSVCLAVALGCQGTCEGVYWTTATEIGGKSRGFAGAFMNAGGNAGGSISPLLTPVIAGLVSERAAFEVAAALCAFGGLVWIWIKLPDPVRRGRPVDDDEAATA